MPAQQRRVPIFPVIGLLLVIALAAGFSLMRAQADAEAVEKAVGLENKDFQLPGDLEISTQRPAQRPAANRLNFLIRDCAASWEEAQFRLTWKPANPDAVHHVIMDGSIVATIDKYEPVIVPSGDPDHSFSVQTTSSDGLVGSVECPVNKSRKLRN